MLQQLLCHIRPDLSNIPCLLNELLIGTNLLGVLLIQLVHPLNTRKEITILRLTKDSLKSVEVCNVAFPLAITFHLETPNRDVGVLGKFRVLLHWVVVQSLDVHLVSDILPAEQVLYLLPNVLPRLCYSTNDATKVASHELPNSTHYRPKHQCMKTEYELSNRDHHLDKSREELEHSRLFEPVPSQLYSTSHSMQRQSYHVTCEEHAKHIYTALPGGLTKTLDASLYRKECLDDEHYELGYRSSGLRQPIYCLEEELSNRHQYAEQTLQKPNSLKRKRLQGFDYVILDSFYAPRQLWSKPLPEKEEQPPNEKRNGYWMHQNLLEYAVC